MPPVFKSTFLLKFCNLFVRNALKNNSYLSHLLLDSGYDETFYDIGEIRPIFTSIMLHSCSTCLILLTRILLLRRHFEYESPQASFPCNFRILSESAYLTIAVVTLQTFYLGKHDLLTVYLGKLDFLGVTDFSLGNLPRGNFIVRVLDMSRKQQSFP